MIEGLKFCGKSWIIFKSTHLYEVISIGLIMCHSSVGNHMVVPEKTKYFSSDAPYTNDKNGSDENAPQSRDKD